MSEDVRSLLMDVLYLSDIYAYRRETEVTAWGDDSQAGSGETRFAGHIDRDSCRHRVADSERLDAQDSRW